MITSINILHIEDNEDDALLIERVLLKGGISALVKRVETAEDLEQLLKTESWDIILADFNLPQYNGMAALELVMTVKPDIPFVLVSGAVGEETAVELMRKGAVDYIMKDNLSRLVPVVNRELKEIRNRRKTVEMNLAMQSIVKSIVGTTGKDSFEKIIEGLCEWVGADSGLIGVVNEGSIQTLSNLMNHKKSQNFNYQISGTPCQEVMNTGFHLYPKDVCCLFPKDKNLNDTGAESYVGVPLHDALNNVIGVLCVFSKQQMKAPVRLRDYMEIVAAKAASGIELYNKEQERQSLEEQLLHSQKMESIGTLTGGIAHDFNNILSIIIGNTELAMDDITKDNSVYINLEAIKTAGLSATDIVKQLLYISRKTNNTPVELEIVSSVNGILKLLRSTIPDTIDIRTRLFAEHGTIKADPVQINQILINLCMNASQAMEGENGIIEVSVDKMELENEPDHNYPGLVYGKYIKLTVADTGPGIEPHHIVRIFDPYFTTKMIGKGTGMGLAVVHGIVKSHNGYIFVHSQPGVGATFTVFFPLVEK